MSESFKQVSPVGLPGQVRSQAGKVLRRLLRQQRILAIALLAFLFAALYWGILASDRYVSEAHVIIERTDLSGGQSMDFGSLLGNVNGSSRTDQLLLRDHLLSVDMLQKLDSKLDLRGHYSDSKFDILSRMWGKDVPAERFHRHYLSRVSVEFDEYAGVLVIKTQAFDAAKAHAIASMLVEEGERFMNAMAHSLAEGQVSFLEKQVADLGKRAIQARQAMLQFQNQKGLASPQATAENLVGIINRLEGQVTDLQTRRAALLGYLMPDSANVVEINQQIAAVEKQIQQEKARIASPGGKTLNSTVEEYQRLQLDAEFNQDVYKTALVALEKGRIEATRMLKKVSVLQRPNVPQYPLEPRRLYNIFAFFLAAMVIAGIMHLIAAIIRDHKD